MCFVQSQLPAKLDDPKQHQIKGLNVETVVKIPIPSPAWITSPDYWILPAKSDNDVSNSAFFSLNFSMYPSTIDPFEWDSMWFFTYGRVHPYALTWEVKSGDGVHPDDLQDYTIPALIVRDQGYQP